VRDLERARQGIELRSTFHLVMEPHQVHLLRRWDPLSMPDDENVASMEEPSRDDVARLFDLAERTVPALVEHLAELVSASG
jgi:hypothetical protein